MRVWIGLVVLGLAACGDNGSSGDDDSAPDAGVVHAGPCTASGPSYECTYTYDDRGLPASATCLEDHPIEPGMVGVTWTHDGDALIGLRRISQYENAGMRDVVWDLGATTPTRHEEGHDGGVFSWVYDEDYEPGPIVLVGQLFDLATLPYAEDRRIHFHGVFHNLKDDSDSITDLTYTFAPAAIPTDGVRTRTDSEGASVDFEYAGGRLVAGLARRFVWQDGRLTRIEILEGDQPDVEYVYDDAGNLIERHAATVVTTYDYGCW
jgi:YD repeat-containing protein